MVQRGAQQGEAVSAALWAKMRIGAEGTPCSQAGTRARRRKSTSTLAQVKSEWRGVVLDRGKGRPASASCDGNDGSLCGTPSPSDDVTVRVAKTDLAPSSGCDGCVCGQAGSAARRQVLQCFRSSLHEESSLLCRCAKQAGLTARLE